MRTSPTSQLLLLTAISVNLELCLLIRTLDRGDSALVTGTLLTAFHFGYLLADRARSSDGRLLRAGAAISLVCVAIGLLSPWAMSALAPVLLASTCLQGMRRQLKPRAHRDPVPKNAVKFGAMVASGLAAVPLGFSALLLFSGAVAWLVPRSASQVAAGEPSDQVRAQPSVALLATEFLHHAHYFVYCYVFWRLIPDVPPVAVGGLFSIGWLAYFVAEGVIGSRQTSSTLLIAGGHLLCAASLVAMAASSSLLITMLMWFLTGVGGGTAYALGYGPQARNRERFEDLGHVTGTFSGGVTAAAATPSIAVLVAAGLASGTAIAAWGAYRQASQGQG